MKQKKTTISEREIKAMLRGLREEVAAPPDFRSRILRQLAAETGQSAPASSNPVWRRLIDFVARPALVPVLASLAALGFGLWFAARPQPQAPLALAAPGLAQAQNEVKAQRPLQTAKAKPKAAPAGIAALPGNSAVQAPAAAGSAPQDAAPTQNKFSALPADSVGAAGLPTAVPVPGAAPKHDGLNLSSQVRRNRFLASRGEYAAITFKLKAPGRARVECYDRTGRLVAVLHDADEGAGTFEVRWYGHDDSGQLAPTGIYALRIMTPEYKDTHKIVLVR